MQNLTYKEVAKNIVKETIASALFIDDKALENFKSKSYSKHKSEHQRTLELYRDFKKHDCLLHSFKFTKSGWKKNSHFYLRNKDLLILDWQLVGEDHSEALKILERAARQKSLHFLCIYTQESKDSVKNELNRFFLGKISKEETYSTRIFFNNTELEGLWEINENDDEWIDFEESINNIINSKKSDEQEQIDAFTEKYDLQEEQLNFIDKLGSNTKAKFSSLKSALRERNENFSREFDKEGFIPSDEDQWTFYINHTIVKIFAKDDIDGNQLYDSFLDSFLSNEQNIFLSLMGLEMRNRFRENSAFIGKDFEGLSENAFFHHKQKNDNENPDLFVDFLIDVLKEQIGSFLYEDNFKLFSVLDEYFQSINGNKRLAQFKEPANSENFINEIFNLNYFYNRINIDKRKKDDILKFGDVFKFSAKNDQEDIIEERYFLCITPHCDCLRAEEKINNQFWFVEGSREKNQAGALKQADSKFISFLKDESNIVAIDWKKGKKFCQPFGIFVPNNKFNKRIEAFINNKKFEMEFLMSIKDNYTQRIANEAFGYPIRVGIDYVKK